MPVLHVKQRFAHYSALQGTHMGWQSDWLYRLIFDEVTKLWSQAQQEGAGRFGPAPDRFYIQQYAAVRGLASENSWHRFVENPPNTRMVSNRTDRTAFGGGYSG